jgi:hypothetical protein
MAGIQGFEWFGFLILLLTLGVVGLFLYFVCKWLRVNRSK